LLVTKKIKTKQNGFEGLSTI